MKMAFIAILGLLASLAVIVWLWPVSTPTVIGSLPRQDLTQVQKLAREEMRRQAWRQAFPISSITDSAYALGRWLTTRVDEIHVVSPESVEVKIRWYSRLNHSELQLHKHEGQWSITRRVTLFGAAGVGSPVGFVGTPVRLQLPSGMVSNSHLGIFSDEPFVQVGQTNLAQPPVLAPDPGFSNRANLRY